ncbi:MAG: hypothetical protein ACTSUE_23705 [Promethearchaeota archaeon]
MDLLHSDDEVHENNETPLQTSMKRVHTFLEAFATIDSVPVQSLGEDKIQKIVGDLDWYNGFNGKWVMCIRDMSIVVQLTKPLEKRPRRSRKNKEMLTQLHQELPPVYPHPRHNIKISKSNKKRIITFPGKTLLLMWTPKYEFDSGASVFEGIGSVSPYLLNQNETTGFHCFLAKCAMKTDLPTRKRPKTNKRSPKQEQARSQKYVDFTTSTYKSKKIKEQEKHNPVTTVEDPHKKKFVKFTTLMGSFVERDLVTGKNKRVFSTGIAPFHLLYNLQEE